MSEAVTEPLSCSPRWLPWHGATSSGKRVPFSSHTDTLSPFSNSILPQRAPFPNLHTVTVLVCGGLCTPETSDFSSALHLPLRSYLSALLLGPAPPPRLYTLLPAPPPCSSSSSHYPPLRTLCLWVSLVCPRPPESARHGVLTH